MFVSNFSIKLGKRKKIEKEGCERQRKEMFQVTQNLYVTTEHMFQTSLRMLANTFST